MTPLLDRYLRQWAFYKRSLIAFMAINVFAVCMAIVLGINFFIVKSDIADSQKAALNRVAAADSALDRLDVFITDLKARPRFEVRSRVDEQRALGILADWQEIKSLLTQTSSAEHDLDHAALIFTPEGHSKLTDLQKRLRLARAKDIEALRQDNAAHTRRVSLIVLTGLLTLLFGLILPNLVVYLMGRGLNRMRLEIQDSALEFLNRFNATRAGFGSDAFKSAEFWLQIVLLLGQEASRYSRHPVVHLSGELAHLIRVELKKKSDSSAA